MNPSVTYDQLTTLVSNFEAIYPDVYYYAADPNTTIKTFLLFRNREESFDPTQAVVTIKYRD